MFVFGQNDAKLFFGIFTLQTIYMQNIYLEILTFMDCNLLFREYLYYLWMTKACID